MDRLPVTAHGKIDRSALPVPPVVRQPYRAPESELQRLVADHFAKITETERVGLDDDFFEVGGNSLTGVALSAELAAATGLPMTVRWLYTAPTVRELAARLAEHAGGSATDDALGVVLTLRRNGSRPPLFCVHSAVPLAWCYGALAQQLDDRPVYGLQALTLEGEPRAGATIDDLADGYVQEILRVRPEALTICSAGHWAGRSRMPSPSGWPNAVRRSRHWPCWTASSFPTICRSPRCRACVIC